MGGISFFDFVEKEVFATGLVFCNSSKEENDFEAAAVAEVEEESILPASNSLLGKWNKEVNSEVFKYINFFLSKSLNVYFLTA